MSKMVRRQVVITAEQNKQLKAHTADVGLSEAAVIRRDIERVLEQAPPPADEGDWKDAWREACRMWKDRDDFPELYAELRQRNRHRMQRIQADARQVIS